MDVCVLGWRWGVAYFARDDGSQEVEDPYQTSVLMHTKNKQKKKAVKELTFLSTNKYMQLKDRNVKELTFFTQQQTQSSALSRVHIFSMSEI